MHSDHSEIESRLRRSRSAGMMAPPAGALVDAAALPDRVASRPRINNVPAVLGFVVFAAISLSIFLIAKRPPAGPSASEAVSLSFEAIPQSGADLTKRFVEPVRREWQSVALHSRRASDAFRGGLERLR